MTSRYLLSFILLSSLILSSSLADLGAQGQTNEKKPLPIGTEFIETISPGQKHLYQVRLEIGQYLEVTVEQRGIDLSLSFEDPAGKTILSLDSALGRLFAETGSIVADTSGVYVVEIAVVAGAVEPGKYSLQAAPLHEATETDRHHSAADLAMAEGDVIRLAGKDLPLAVEKYSLSISESRQARNADREADAEITMGYTYYQLGDNRKALETFNEALTVSRAAHATNLEIDAILNTGVVYRYMGEWQDALTNYQKALGICRTTNDLTREAIILVNLGTTYRLMGDPDEALSYFRQANRIAAQNKDRAREITSLSSIGVIYTDLGKFNRVYYQKAFENFDQAIQICKETRNENRLALVSLNKGVASMELGQFPEALKLLEQASEIYDRKKLKRDLAIAFNEIARVYELQGRFDLALAKYDKAREVGNEAKDVPVQTRSLTGAARVERKLGNLRRSRELIAEAIKTIESLRAKIGNPDLRASYLSLHRRSFDFYIDLLTQLSRLEPGADYAAAALRASESARSRVLLDNMLETRAELKEKGKQTNSQCQNFAELVDREQALQKRLEVEAVENNVDELIHEYRLVASQIKSCNPNYYALIYQKPLDQAEIQKRVLGPDTILLEFALGEESSHLFLLTNKSLQIFDLPKREEIEKAAKDFYQNLQARSIEGETPARLLQLIKKADADLPRSAAKLSQLLLSDVAPQVPGKRLLIVGDGELYRIPFSALPLPQTGENNGLRGPTKTRLLVSTNEIIQLPSATVLEFLLEKPARTKDARQTVAVIADPVFSTHDQRLGAKLTAQLTPRTPRSRQSQDGDAFAVDQYERLRGTQKEAAMIKSLVPVNERLIALGFDANQDLVMSGRLSNYRYIHFATHSVYNRHPELSGLALSMFDQMGKEQDGYLRLAEILNLKLDADLVVLSSCETGVGKPMRGEGLIGMTRGFLAAGAERVMASLWKVDDEATSQLMGHFYRALLQNKKMTPAAALRHAQLEMLRRQPNLPPFFWAGFVIQGNPR